MRIIFLIPLILILLTGCNRSEIKEGSTVDGITAQRIVVNVDEKQCRTAWGEVLMSGESRKAYKSNSTASCKQTCDEIATTLSCKDGVLEGNNVFIHPICNRPKCDCTLDFLVDKPVIKDGDYIKLYTAASVQCGLCSQKEVQRQCVDGVLSGDNNAKNQSCDEISCKDCKITDTYFLKHNESKNFFKGSTGLNCDAQKKCESSTMNLTRTCENGILSGDSQFNSLSCRNDYCDCKIQNSVYKHNDNVTYFTRAASKCSDNFACIDSGIKVNSKCIDGIVTGLAANAPVFNLCAQDKCNCSVLDAMGAEVQIPDQTTKEVYSLATVACGRNCSEVKGQVSCNRGTPTGNLTFSNFSCSSNTCSCKFGSIDIPNGESRDVFGHASPMCGTTCGASKGRVTCTNGRISGDTNLLETTCREQTCDCKYTNLDNAVITIADGRINVPVYTEKIATCGTTCDSKKGIINCTKTVLSGQTSYKSDTCAAQQCECNSPWGEKYLARETIAGQIPFFKMEVSICGSLKCSATPDLYKNYYCLKRGSTTAWVDQAGNNVTDFSVYKFKGCTDPTCNCTVGGKSILEQTSAGFYRAGRVACGQTCETPENYVSIRCNTNLTTTPTPADVNLATFFSSTPAPVSSCKPDDCPPGAVVTPPGSSGGGNNGTGNGQIGDGGGSGGGTGDGEGIGIGFGGRPRGSPSSGPSSGGRVPLFVHSWQKMGSKEPCKVPWNNGQVSHGASVIAFTRDRAETGKKCSTYRLTLICLEGSLRGPNNPNLFMKCEE